MNKRIQHNKGQTAIELAVFGSILIFVIGVIIKQSMSFGYTQNQNYKALRWAMTTSFLHTMGLVEPMGDDDAGTSSRNQATVLIVEDRLQVGADKHRSLDRVPYVHSANATYSRNLFLGIESGEDYNLPVLDVFVNGKHFVFRLAGFKTVNTTPSAGDPHVIKCGSISTCTSQSTNAEGETICDTWDTVDMPCQLFFTKIPNNPAMEEWCVSGCSGLPEDYRFDLDRSGSAFSSASYDPANESGYFGTAGMPDPDVPGPNPWDLSRGVFSWQWVGVPAFNEDADNETNFSQVGAMDWADTTGVSMDESEHLMVDVDNDQKEERIVKVNNNSEGVITSVEVVDFQEGDYDVTEDSRETGHRLGFTHDLQLYTFAKSGEGDQGTYLLIEHGNLYNPANGQYVRSTQKKDQVDIVQRIFYLANDTGRFCDASGTPVSAPNGGWTSDIPNPVEACEDCFMQNNVALTCFDSTSTPDKADRPVIYIRSWIADLHGRKWITSLEDDFSSGHYVDFDVPSTP
jgi:hypothetical protein